MRLPSVHRTYAASGSPPLPEGLVLDLNLCVVAPGPTVAIVGLMQTAGIQMRRAGAYLCETCEVTAGPFERMRGLLGRDDLATGEGMLIKPAPSVHTFFMRFPIDVLFLDRDMRVLRIARELRPWRMAACRKARAVLELPAGEAERRGVRVGDRLRVSEAAA